MLTNLCHLDLFSHVSVLKAVLSEASPCSDIPIVCTCFVAWYMVFPRTSAICLIIRDMKTDPLSELMDAGMKAGLVMMLIMTFTIAFACCLEVG